jgi:hypothetical protein
VRSYPRSSSHFLPHPYASGSVGKVSWKTRRSPTARRSVATTAKPLSGDRLSLVAVLALVAWGGIPALVKTSQVGSVRRWIFRFFGYRDRRSTSAAALALTVDPGVPDARASAAESEALVMSDACGARQHRGSGRGDEACRSADNPGSAPLLPRCSSSGSVICTVHRSRAADQQGRA